MLIEVLAAAVMLVQSRSPVEFARLTVDTAGSGCVVADERAQLL